MVELSDWLQDHIPALLRDPEKWIIRFKEDVRSIEAVESVSPSGVPRVACKAAMRDGRTIQSSWVVPSQEQQAEFGLPAAEAIARAGRIEFLEQWLDWRKSISRTA